LLRPTIKALCALAALAAGSPCAAGTASGSFAVNITLTQPGATPGAGASGICTSQSLSDQTGAVVQVVCRTGEFVSIGPRPGGRFIGTHGGAYTYSFGPSLGGSGTITSFRVYSLEGTEGPIDMLVSF
jgi:hypothetical protein